MIGDVNPLKSHIVFCPYPSSLIVQSHLVPFDLPYTKNGFVLLVILSEVLTTAIPFPS